MVQKKKILITGAGGYVGATIAEALKDDYEVVGFGHNAEINADITDYKKLSRAAKGAYAIIHTASPTKESWCNEHPYEALRTIVHGTRYVRRVAEENKVPLVIHFSTQAVYSNFAKRPMPLREDMELKPDTFYGALKALAEGEFYGSRAVILRPANIYGIGASVLRRNVVHVFAENAGKSAPLTVVNGGAQKADFVHVQDIARLVKIIITKHITQSTKQKIKNGGRVVAINIGSGRATSIRDIARLVVAETKRLKKKPPEIISQPAPAGTIAADRWLSIAKARKRYGWKPGITLEQGVKELLGRFSNLKS